MHTANLVWEEFTGSNNQPKNKEDKSKIKLVSSVRNPPKIHKCKLVDHNI